MAAARQLRVLVCSEISGLQQAAAVACKARLGANVAIDWVERSPDALEPGGDARQELLETEVLLADPGAVVSVVDDAAKLRWMQSTWAGVNVLFSNTTKRDYVCTRVAGIFGPLMAEYVLGYILLLERKLLLAKSQQEAKAWVEQPFKEGTRPLAGLTMGLLGCGDIGLQIVKAAKVMGLKTAAFKRDISVPVEGVDMLSSDVQAVLKASDFVVNTLPSTPATRGLLCGDALAICATAERKQSKRPTTFINVGRGDIMAEDDIINALDSGWIGHAILDVFPVEPLPTDSPLWTHPNVIITPHVSAVSFPKDVAELFAANVERYLESTADASAPSISTTTSDLRLAKILKHVVAWENGY